MKLIKIKQKSSIYFRDYIFFSNGKCFSVCKNELYQLYLLKFESTQTENGNDLLSISGYKSESGRILGSDEFKRPETVGSIAKLGSSTEYEFESTYYVENNILEQKEKKVKINYETLKQFSPESYDYIFVFISTVDETRIIIPMQKVLYREIEYKKPEFFEETKPNELEFNVEKFSIIIGDKSVIKTTIESIENIPKITEEEIELEDKKIEYFEIPKQFKTTSGKILNADGINKLSNVYFGSWLDSGELAEVPTNEILEEVTVKEKE